GELDDQRRGELAAGIGDLPVPRHLGHGRRNRGARTARQQRDAGQRQREQASLTRHRYSGLPMGAVWSAGHGWPPKPASSALRSASSTIAAGPESGAGARTLLTRSQI